MLLGFERRWLQSRQCYTRALAIDPTHARSLYYFALQLNHQWRDFEGAEALFRRCVRLHPTYVNCLRGYALFLRHHHRDIDGCEGMLRRVLALPAGAASPKTQYTWARLWAV